MGLSLSVDSLAGRADPDNQKQITYFFSDQTSLLFVFVRALRWCFVAVVLHLAFAQLWYDRATRYRSSWFSTYPFQIYGVCLSLLLAVRLWASLQRSWQFGLQLQALGNKLSEYAALGLALEEHSRGRGCGTCNKPCSEQEWIDQQNYRMAFLHYVSLLHAVAVASLSGARKPHFQKHPKDVLQGHKSPRSAELCDCPHSPRSEAPHVEQSAGPHAPHAPSAHSSSPAHSPKAFGAGSPEITTAGGSSQMSAVHNGPLRDPPTQAGTSPLSERPYSAAPSQHNDYTNRFQGPRSGAAVSATTTAPQHTAGLSQAPQDSATQTGPMQQANISPSSPLHSPTNAVNQPISGAVKPTGGSDHTTSHVAPLHGPHAIPAETPPTPPPSLGANPSVKNVADDGSTNSQLKTSPEGKPKSILKKTQPDGKEQSEGKTVTGVHNKDGSEAPTTNDAGSVSLVAQQHASTSQATGSKSHMVHTTGAVSTEASQASKAEHSPTPEGSKSGTAEHEEPNGKVSSAKQFFESFTPRAHAQHTRELEGAAYRPRISASDPNGALSGPYIRQEHFNSPVSVASDNGPVEYADGYGQRYDAGYGYDYEYDRQYEQQYVDEYGQVCGPEFYDPEYGQQWSPDQAHAQFGEQHYDDWAPVDPAAAAAPLGYDEAYGAVYGPSTQQAAQPVGFGTPSPGASSPKNMQVQRSMYDASESQSTAFSDHQYNGEYMEEGPPWGRTYESAGVSGYEHNRHECIEERPLHGTDRSSAVPNSGQNYNGNGYTEEGVYGTHTVPQQLSQYGPYYGPPQAAAYTPSPHYTHAQHAQHYSAHAMYEGVKGENQGQSMETIPSTNLEVASISGNEYPTDALEPQDSGMITLRGGMATVDAVAAHAADPDAEMDGYAELPPKRVEEGENRMHLRAPADALHFDARPMRRRNPPGPNPFLKIVGGILGTDSGSRAQRRYRHQHQTRLGHKKVGVRLNKAIAESQSLNGSDKASDDALVWHENPMATQEQEQQSTDTTIVAMPVVEGATSGRDVKDKERRRGRTSQSDSDSSGGSDFESERKPVRLSLLTLGAHSGSEQRRKACFTVILGLSTSQREYLGLRRDSSSGKHSMSNSERLRSVQKWLQGHLLEGSSGTPRDSSMMLPSVYERRDHLHSLLTDALDAYTTCKATTESSITSAWLLSSAALLALFSVVLPVVSAARISNLLISAAITGFLVLGLSVMFELATYLDAFVVLVPSAAEATQTTLNDRLVTSARGSVPHRIGGPYPHQLIKKKGQMNARIQSCDNTMHSIQQPRSGRKLTNEKRLNAMSPGVKGTAHAHHRAGSRSPTRSVSPSRSDPTAQKSSHGTKSQHQQRAVNNPLYSDDDGAAKHPPQARGTPHHRAHTADIAPSYASKVACEPEEGDSCCQPRMHAPPGGEIQPHANPHTDYFPDPPAHQHGSSRAQISSSAPEPHVNMSMNPHNEEPQSSRTPQRVVHHHLQASSNSRPPLHRQHSSTPSPTDAPVLKTSAATEDNVRRATRARQRTRHSYGSDPPSSPSWSSDSSPERDGFFSKPSIDSAQAVPYVHSHPGSADAPSTQVQLPRRSGDQPIDLVAPSHAEARPPAHMHSIPPPLVQKNQVRPIPQTSGPLELTVQDSEKLPAAQNGSPPAPAPKTVASVNAAALRGEKVAAADLLRPDIHHHNHNHHHHQHTVSKGHAHPADAGLQEEPPQRLREKYGVGKSRDSAQRNSIQGLDGAAHTSQTLSGRPQNHRVRGVYAAASTGALPEVSSGNQSTFRTNHDSPRTARAPPQTSTAAAPQKDRKSTEPAGSSSAKDHRAHHPAQQTPSEHPDSSTVTASGLEGPVLPAVNTKPAHGQSKTKIVSTKKGPVMIRVPVNAKHASTAAQKQLQSGQGASRGQDASRSLSPTRPVSASDAQVVHASRNVSPNRLSNTAATGTTHGSPDRIPNAADVQARPQPAVASSATVAGNSRPTHTTQMTTSKSNHGSTQQKPSSSQFNKSQDPTGSPKSTGRGSSKPSAVQPKATASGLASAHDAHAPQAPKQAAASPQKPQNTPHSANSTNYQQYKLQQVPVPAVWMPESAQPAAVAHFVHSTPRGGAYVTHHAVPHTAPLAAPHTASHITPSSRPGSHVSAYPAPHTVPPHGIQYMHGSPYMAPSAVHHAVPKSPRGACDSCRAWPHKVPTPAPLKAHQNGIATGANHAAPKVHSSTGVRTKIVTTKTGPVRVTIKSPRTAQIADAQAGTSEYATTYVQDP